MIVNKNSSKYLFDSLILSFDKSIRTRIVWSRRTWLNRQSLAKVQPKVIDYTSISVCVNRSRNSVYSNNINLLSLLLLPPPIPPRRGFYLRRSNLHTVLNDPSPSHCHWAASSGVVSLAQRRPRCWFCLTWLSPTSLNTTFVSPGFLLRHSEHQNMWPLSYHPSPIFQRTLSARREECINVGLLSYCNGDRLRIIRAARKETKCPVVSKINAINPQLGSSPNIGFSWEKVANHPRQRYSAQEVIEEYVGRTIAQLRQRVLFLPL